MTRKPEPQVAMRQLIDQVRTAIPFDISEAELCAGSCHGCPKKLIEYLDTELADWSDRLDHNETPLLGDVDRLGKTSRKIYNALQKNRVV